MNEYFPDIDNPNIGNNGLNDGPDTLGDPGLPHKTIAIIVLIIIVLCSIIAGLIYTNHQKNRQRVDNVIHLIDALGEPNAVTMDQRTPIDTARGFYNELTADQKDLVTNKGNLFGAESVIDQLDKKEEQDRAGLTEEDFDRQQEIFEQQREDLNRQNEKSNTLAEDLAEKPYSYAMTNPVSWGAYKVTTDSAPLTLRSGPSYDDKRLAKIPKGSVVYVYGSYNGWYYVDYNGQWGWCNGKYLTEQAEEPLVPELMAESSGYKEIESDPSYIGDYIVVTKQMHLRSGPGTGYVSRGILSKGDPVAAYGTYDGWLYVEYKGQKGWTSGKTKYIKKAEDSTLAESESATETKLPSECQTIVSKPTLVGDFTVIANDLNMRTGPGTEYKKIVELHKNNVVNGYETYNGWRYVEYKDHWGWMKDEHLKGDVKKADTETTYLIPPPAYKELGEFKVSTKETDLSLRYAPEKNAKEICGMPKGSIVSAHGYKDGWYYVKYNGKEGWAGEAYLTVQMKRPSHEAYIGDYIMTTSSTMRYGPGSDYKERSSISKDAAVSVYGFENGWSFIYYDDKDIDGWVKEDYLKKKSSGVMSTPE